MRPATFSYVRAETVDAATAALRETEGAQPLAGGQSLINRMRARVVRPTAVVDIRTTWPGPSDFDVYFQDQAGTTLESDGAVAGMPEHILYVPASGVNTYRIRTLVFAAANETFHCTVRLLETPPVNSGAAM